MNLKRIYNGLWNESLQKFSRNRFELDPVLNSETDDRYGVSLIVRPSKEVKRNISDVLDEIKTAAPHQYYYPGSDLHVTVLTLISCYSGFSLDQIDVSEYQKIVQSSLSSILPFEIEFRGLTASPSCLLIQGFPKGDQLPVLRNTLRENFKSSRLEHSMDKIYERQTAHITAVRFKEPLETPEKFIEKITLLRDTVFGSCVIEEAELVGNDWYHKQEKVKLIAKLPFSKPKES